MACNVCTQKLPPPKCLSTVAAPFSPIRVVLREWSCDQGGDICPNHYRDIWHLRPLSADMLSYLGADVEISCPGVLANSTSRNGPMDHSCSRWNHRSQRGKLLGSSCPTALGICHWIFPLCQTLCPGLELVYSVLLVGTRVIRRIRFGSWIPQLPWDHPNVFNYWLVTAVPR